MSSKIDKKLFQFGRIIKLVDSRPKCSVSAEVQIKFSERRSIIFIYITFKINQEFLGKKKQDGESL